MTNPARDTHRFLTVRLMQSALDCDMITAANRLELPMDLAQPSCTKMIRWADRHGRHAELATATERAVAAFGQLTAVIDYQNRRDQLREWTIPAEVWRHTMRALRELPTRQWWPSRLRGPELDDMKRLHTSVFLWRDITRGDFQACPIYLNRAQLSDVDPQKFKSNLQSAISLYDIATSGFSTARNHMLPVMKAFDDYRKRLERDVDALPRNT